jgi:hypothetical protein
MFYLDNRRHIREFLGLSLVFLPRIIATRGTYRFSAAVSRAGWRAAGQVDDRRHC